MSALRIESTRSGRVESEHRVSLAVVDAAGRLVAWAGEPQKVTYWRSSAKPFQALPMVQDGAADRFGFGPRELALSCASHSSHPVHRGLCAQMLAAVGCQEEDLACGPHPPIDAALATQVVREGTRVTPVWSNCSGKHTGMLALARHHGWPIEGYAREGHPVQERIRAEVARWAGLAPDEVGMGVDGCTAVCFALPLSGMALAYARFGSSQEDAAVRLRSAMTLHPELVAGPGRSCTEVMTAYAGELVVKVGAEGIYSAALPRFGLGLCLKVESGDGRCAPVALLEVLHQLARAGLAPQPTAQSLLERHARLDLHNTRGESVGELRPAGKLTLG